MEVLWTWVLDNFEIVLAAVFTVIGVFLVKDRLAIWKLANNTFFFAWSEAERLGVLENLKGVEKLRPYIEIWKAQYEAKWGEAPTQKQIDYAIKMAEKISLEHKSVQQVVKSMSDPR